MKVTCCNFAVSQRPVAYWSYDVMEDNADYLDGLDSKYFSEQVEWLRAQLDSPNRARAAVAIRLLYAHALETFFSLLAAALQAPMCPLGWILSYSPSELREVVDGIAKGNLTLVRFPMPVTWVTVSKEINDFTIPDQAANEWVQSGFATTWARLGREFIDPTFIDEHNSLKHGLRVTPGGFSLRLGPSGDPDAQPFIDSKSEFGASYFAKKKLDRFNITAEHAGINWNPIGCAIGIELLTLSINNVITYLKRRAQHRPGTVQYLWPTGPANAFEAAFDAGYMVQSMKRSGIELDDIEACSADQILSTYREEK